MKRNLLLLLFIGIFILGIERLGLLRPVGGFLDRSTQGVQLAFYAAGRKTADQFATVLAIGKLREDNSAYITKIALLEAENGTLSKLEAENKVLKEQLGLPIEDRKDLKSASVIGFSLAKSRGFISINKGTRDGLQGGDIVVVGKVVIGKLENPGESSSLVKLLTDPESKYLAESQSSVKGVVIGDFGSQMRLTKVLLDDTLNTGDLIYTTGEEGMPKGLVIGRITRVKRLESELFQEAEVSPMLDINGLDLVFIRSN